LRGTFGGREEKKTKLVAPYFVDHFTVVTPQRALAIMSSILFEDYFEVKAINKDGTFFDRVSRLDCTSDNFEMELQLDINSEIYKLRLNQKFTMALAKSLNLDGSNTQPADGAPSLLDKYEYAMFGKVFKIKEGTNMKISVFASFGGLLMLLKGDQRNLQGIELDNNIYLLIRKID
jgi:DNA-directed RNA polymerase I, II, and III subunit RPABC3